MKCVNQRPLGRALSAGLFCVAILATGFAGSGVFTSSSVERFPAESSRDRILEACGKHYADEVDSVTDYDSRGFDWFSAEARVLSDPHEALAARLNLIREAKRSVRLSTYIFKSDESAYAILDELRMAIERGVSVQLMVDSSGSLGGSITPTNKSSVAHSDIKSLLYAKPGINRETHRRATVDVVVFRPILLPKSVYQWGKDLISGKNRDERTSINLNRRSHDKILLVDAEDRSHARAIVGGRNIHNSYYGVPRVDAETYEDMEVLVRDVADAPGALDLQSTLGFHFKRLLCHKGNHWLKRTLSFDISSKINGASNRLRQALKLDRYVSALGHKTYRSLVRLGDEIENIKRPSSEAVDDPDHDIDVFGRNGNSIVYQLKELIRKADRTIDICSPYLYLNSAERARLKAWVMAKPGRRIRIISNSVLTSDNMMAQTLVDTEMSPDFMTRGWFQVKQPNGQKTKLYWNPSESARIYELGRLDSTDFGGSAFYGKLHAKYAIIDGRYSVVASHNGDPRSRHLNSEVGFFIDNEAVAAELTDQFEKTIARSYLWGSSEWQRLIEHPKLRSKMTQIELLNKIVFKFKALKSLI